jgi:hypothetical protein
LNFHDKDGYPIKSIEEEYNVNGNAGISQTAFVLATDAKGVNRKWINRYGTVHPQHPSLRG